MMYSLSKVNQTNIMVLPVKNCFASNVGDLCKWVMNRRRWIHVKLMVSVAMYLNLFRTFQDLFGCTALSRLSPPVLKPLRFSLSLC